jgi:hypothetical protein
MQMHQKYIFKFWFLKKHQQDKNSQNSKVGGQIIEMHQQQFVWVFCFFFLEKYFEIEG